MSIEEPAAFLDRMALVINDGECERMVRDRDAEVTADLRARLTVEPTRVQLPDEPCVVLWDGGDKAVIATERVCHPVVEWARWAGPIARPVMVARLRAIADQIELATEGGAA